MESWKTHLTDGIMKDHLTASGASISSGMGLSWFHLADGSFMIPSGRWVFHDSIWQMGLSWFHLADWSFMIPSGKSWKTHLPDGIMKDPSARWNHERPICQMESWNTHLKDGIMKYPSDRWDGSFMIPSVRWVFHDSIWQMGLSWFHLADGSFMIPSGRWVFHDSIC